MMGANGDWLLIEAKSNETIATTCGSVPRFDIPSNLANASRFLTVYPIEKSCRWLIAQTIKKFFCYRRDAARCPYSSYELATASLVVAPFGAR